MRCLPMLRLALVLGPAFVLPGMAADAPPPASRIVTLAPHLAELAYAAGAGDRLVATVAFSDEPPAARQLPRVGDAFRVDYEVILGLRPDLVLGWPSGNSVAVLDRLRGLGLRVVALEPASLADIGAQIESIGVLAGTGDNARPAAAAWTAGLAELREQYRDRRPVSVFYQVQPQPLVTVTGAHFIGQAIALCGGRNVFADVPGLTPVVGVEAVVAARPEVIVVSGLVGAGPDPRAAWARWGSVPAVAAGQVAVADPAVMSIPGPRLLGGIAGLCGAIDAARGQVPATPADVVTPAGATQGAASSTQLRVLRRAGDGIA